MKIVRHEAEVVNVRLHGLCVKVTQIPVVRRERQTQAVFGSISLTQLLDQEHEIGSVCEFSTAIRGYWVFPVEVLAWSAFVCKRCKTMGTYKTLETILVHERDGRLDESGTAGLRRTHVAPCSMCLSFVAKVIATNGDPSL